MTDDYDDEPTPEPRIRVLLLRPQGGTQVLSIDNQSPIAMHALLGGYMEVFPLPAHLARRNLIGLADEDGYRNQQPYNAYSPLLGRQIVGPVVVLRSEPP